MTMSFWRYRKQWVDHLSLYQLAVAAYTHLYMIARRRFIKIALFLWTSKLVTWVLHSDIITTKRHCRQIKRRLISHLLNDKVPLLKRLRMSSKSQTKKACPMCLSITKITKSRLKILHRINHLRTFKMSSSAASELMQDWKPWLHLAVSPLIFLKISPIRLKTRKENFPKWLVANKSHQ